MSVSNTSNQSEIISRCNSNSNYDLLMSHIYNRDCRSLEKLLKKKKSVDILNCCHKDGWYPLHEAIELGYVDIAKRLVKFTTKYKFEAVNEWDQIMTFHRRCLHSFISTSYPEDLDGRKPQASFLVIAVERKQIEMIQYVCSLYNTHYDKRQTLICDPIKRNRAIYEALVLSFKTPEILRVLLQGLPQYSKFSLHSRRPETDSYSEVLQTALNQNVQKVVSLLLQFSLGVDDLEKKDLVLPRLDVIGYDCVKIARDRNDTAILQILLDLISFKSMAKIDENLSSFGYRILRSSCLCCSAKITEFLVNNGCDVYAFEEKPFDCLYGYFCNMSLCDVFDYRDGKNRQNYKTSALFWAAKGNRLDILKYLFTVVDQQKFKGLRLTSPVAAAAMDYLSVPLELLLENGFSINIEQSLPHSKKMFLEYTLFHRYFQGKPEMQEHEPSANCLKILLKWGALELAFGKHGSTATVKRFLENQWFYIVKTKRRRDGAANYQSTYQSTRTDPGNRQSKLTVRPNNRHPRISWLVEFDVESYAEKFDLFLQHISLYKISDSENLEESFPSLKQLCRFVIRCCIVHKRKTLKPMRELNLPSSVLNYLFCEC